MFLDDNSLKHKIPNHPIHSFSSTTKILKQNVIKQAASMLLQHVTINKPISYPTQNTNGNAFDEYYPSSNHIQRNKKKDFKRTDKCYSWLSKISTKSETSLNRPSVHFYPQIEYPNFAVNESHHISPIFHPKSTNAINPQFESLPQPIIMVHKKRLRRDYFLSTMQNCIQPPYSQNHFYAFDQQNMLKLQRNLHPIEYEKPNPPKRKYYDESDCDCSQTRFNPISSSKKRSIEQYSPRTADHISINKYHPEIQSPSKPEPIPDIDLSDDKQEESPNPTSHIILSRLEKILNLCGELRILAKDVEQHINEHPSPDKNESESEQVDIQPQINSPPPYQQSNDTSSIHSESNKSHQLMQTESFKTKSASLTTLRHPEDICLCFLKTFFEKQQTKRSSDEQNCQLNDDEQEYLNELTKAYLLGREQILKEQEQEKKKFNAFINETLLDEDEEFNNNNNNNQVIAPISPSSISLKSNDQQEGISIKHQMFINEPIAMKTINVLPGIGSKYARQLSDCGFSTVRRLLGFYLMIKDDQHFVIWLNTKARLAIHSAWLCTNALRAWCQIHL